MARWGPVVFARARIPPITKSAPPGVPAGAIGAARQGARRRACLPQTVLGAAASRARPRGGGLWRRGLAVVALRPRWWLRGLGGGCAAVVVAAAAAVAASGPRLRVCGFRSVASWRLTCRSYCRTWRLLVASARILSRSCLLLALLPLHPPLGCLLVLVLRLRLLRCFVRWQQWPAASPDQPTRH